MSISSGRKADKPQLVKGKDYKAFGDYLHDFKKVMNPASVKKALEEDSPPKLVELIKQIDEMNNLSSADEKDIAQKRANLAKQFDDLSPKDLTKVRKLRKKVKEGAVSVKIEAALKELQDSFYSDMFKRVHVTTSNEEARRETILRGIPLYAEAYVYGRYRSTVGLSASDSFLKLFEKAILAAEVPNDQYRILMVPKGLDKDLLVAKNLEEGKADAKTQKEAEKVRSKSDTDWLILGVAKSPECAEIRKQIAHNLFQMLMQSIVDEPIPTDGKIRKPSERTFISCLKAIVRCNAWTEWNTEVALWLGPQLSETYQVKPEALTSIQKYFQASQEQSEKKSMAPAFEALVGDGTNKSLYYQLSELITRTKMLSFLGNKDMRSETISLAGHAEQEKVGEIKGTVVKLKKEVVETRQLLEAEMKKIESLDARKKELMEELAGLGSKKDTAERNVKGLAQYLGVKEKELAKAEGSLAEVQDASLFTPAAVRKFTAS